MTPIEKKALKYATDAHGDQKRKYTGVPYISHPIEVRQILRTFGHTDPLMGSAALLHDVVEDTDVSIDDIYEDFGMIIGDYVSGLTDPVVQGNRKFRKEYSTQEISKKSMQVQIIKCADFISNTKDIGEHDPKFAKVYIKEKEKMLSVFHPEVKKTAIFKKASESVYA